MITAYIHSLTPVASSEPSVSAFSISIKKEGVFQPSIPYMQIKPHQTDFSIQWGFYVIWSDSTSLYYFLTSNSASFGVKLAYFCNFTNFHQ